MVVSDPYSLFSDSGVIEKVHVLAASEEGNNTIIKLSG